jgi:hypothetical protein
MVNVAAFAADPAAVLTYRAGSPVAPDDPFGEVELELHADGRVRLQRRRGAAHEQWSGRTPDAVLAEVVARLATSPFPELPVPGMLPPGAAPVEVRLRGAAGEVVGRSTTYMSTRVPGYREALGALDRLVRAASGGAIASGWGDPPAFIAD